PVDKAPKSDDTVLPRQPVIETIAGRDWSFSGDGLPALQAALGRSYGVTSDAAGNFYQTDLGNNVLVQVDSKGILHVLIGPESDLSGPAGLAVDAAGAVYFGEIGRVRKRLPGGSIVVVAGAARPGNSRDGVP